MIIGDYTLENFGKAGGKSGDELMKIITNLNLRMLLMTMWMILMRVFVRCVYMMLRM